MHDDQAPPSERLGEAVDDVTDDAPKHSSLQQPVSFARSRVASRRSDPEEERCNREHAPEHDPSEPRGWRDKGQCEDEHDDKSDEVRSAIEHDGRKSPPSGDVRVEAEPARPKQVPEPAGQDVVASDPREHELEEATEPERNACNASPAHRLDQVDAPHRSHREHDEPDVRFA